MVGKAVASFFKPASKKEPEQITWRTVDQSLIIGKYSIPKQSLLTASQPRKIAAFDFDDTLISPTAGKWNRNATSWRWWDSCVPGRLRELYGQGYIVAILSNQSNISLKDDPKKLQKDTLSLQNFKNQATSVMRQLDFPISLYAATAQDIYRKPRTGMWREMLEDYDIESPGAIDLASSFFVGDAAGRDKTDSRHKDHACSDRDLAMNIGITFHTPEEYFLNRPVEPFKRVFDPNEFLASQPDIEAQRPVPFQRQKDIELVIFCGSPASGKSSFFWEVMQPQGYERVNQDILKTRERCLKMAREHLNAGKSVAVDNTNADVETRAHWIRMAQEFNIPIRCIHFMTPPRLCEHNDCVRALNSKDTNPESRTMLPGIAFRGFVQRYSEPRLTEGIQDITEIVFQFKGTSEHREIWSRYWVQKFST